MLSVRSRSFHLMAFLLKLLLKFLSSECPQDWHQKVSDCTGSSTHTTTAGCITIKVQTVKALISYWHTPQLSAKCSFCLTIHRQLLYPTDSCCLSTILCSEQKGKGRDHSNISFTEYVGGPQKNRIFLKKKMIYLHFVQKTLNPIQNTLHCKQYTCPVFFPTVWSISRTAEAWCC